MSRARVRVDLTDLRTVGGMPGGVLGHEEARRAVGRLDGAFACTPDGAEIVINVGTLRPPPGIDADTWVDADRRFQLWFEGSPQVLSDWKATSEGRAPWRPVSA